MEKKPSPLATTKLHAYIAAVSSRKAVDKKSRTLRINAAIVLQLEDNDIPLLLDIITTQAQALGTVEQYLKEGSCPQALDTVVAAIEKTEQLAEGGSKKKWGDA